MATLGGLPDDVLPTRPGRPAGRVVCIWTRRLATSAADVDAFSRVVAEEVVTPTSLRLDSQSSLQRH